MTEKTKNKRKGKGFSWKMNTRACFTNMSVSGFTIDNLDTKNISESENNYEEVFIRIRDLFEHNSWCCDNREDRLSACQAIADLLKENLLIRKD